MAPPLRQEPSHSTILIGGQALSHHFGISGRKTNNTRKSTDNKKPSTYKRQHQNKHHSSISTFTTSSTCEPRPGPAREAPGTSGAPQPSTPPIWSSRFSNSTQSRSFGYLGVYPWWWRRSMREERWGQEEGCTITLVGFRKVNNCTIKQAS